MQGLCGSYIGLYRDNGKENGNYHVGFGVSREYIYIYIHI